MGISDTKHLKPDCKLGKKIILTPKGHSLIQWWSGIFNKQAKKEHSIVLFHEMKLYFKTEDCLLFLKH